MDRINEDLLSFHIGSGAHLGCSIEKTALTQPLVSDSTIEYIDNLLAEENIQASEQPKKRGRPKGSTQAGKSSSVNAESASSFGYNLRARNKK